MSTDPAFPLTVHPVIDGFGTRPATTVVDPPGEGYGYWAGGPSALWHDGAVWLAYRLRRPVDAGRGYANVVARSEDGLTFEVVAEVASADFGAASLERPALAVAPDGSWRLYISCSTLGSKHWWVEALAAALPEELGLEERRVVLPGDESTAWKDPVVTVSDGRWEMWACRHDILPPEEADRMDSWYATSADGWDWKLHGPALQGTPGSWDQRGARITAVLPPGEPGSGWTALYDGRATAEENWEERTGAATGTTREKFAPSIPDPLVADRSVRYASPVQRPDGSWLVYYEAQRADGAHDLRVENVPRPSSDSQSS